MRSPSCVQKRRDLDEATSHDPLVLICMDLCTYAGSTFFVGFLDNYGLYCGQRDYLFLLGKGNETPYTRFSGIVYLQLQLSLIFYSKSPLS